MLTSCVGPPTATPFACLLSSEQRMLVAELFFRCQIEGRAPLSDAEWTGFAAQIVTANFPDGFTVFDGEGEWRNPRTGRIGHEQTKILLVAANPAPDLARRLSAVIDAYKARFRQQSVGVVTGYSCAMFEGSRSGAKISYN